jgi:bifunctional non-homologous end joining protein LigD
MGLEEYQKKRDFKKTPEPRGRQSKKAAKKAEAVRAKASPAARTEPLAEGARPTQSSTVSKPAESVAPAAARGEARPCFVVQKHDASHLHYDFRLEMDGVLKSWAVPKGPSLDPAQKRLAVRTEDHPLEYRDFEGVIPEGQYGGGTVMLWDAGAVQYEGNEAETAELVERRKPFTFTLKGTKLKVRFRLVPFAARGETARNWLLIKSHDESAASADILASAPDSAKTGRSLEQIAAAGEQWTEKNKKYGD